MPPCACVPSFRARCHRWVVACSAFLSLVLTSSLFGQTPVTVVLRNGSVLGGETTLAALEFKSIANSTGTAESFPLQDLQFLTMGEQTSDSAVEEITRAIALLDSPNYSEREGAEQKLLKTSMLAVFRNLLEAEKNAASLEKRHRANRILKQIDNAGSSGLRQTPRVVSSSNLDVLKTRVGKRLLGKLSTAVILLRWNDQDLNLPASSISRLQFGRTPPVNQPAAPSEGGLQVSQSLSDDPEWAKIPSLNFLQDHGGNSLEAYMFVDDEFVDQGVRMFGAQGNRVIISDLSGTTDGNTTTKSVCIYDFTKSRRVFDGVVRIRFCVPGMPELPASVTQFGLQLAWIDHPKDLVVEAYDALGNLVTTIEAGGERTQFFGLKSAIPIAFLQVVQNPHLGILGREIDKTYAVLNVRHTLPQLAFTSVNRSELLHARLKDGSLLAARQWKWSDQGLTLEVDDLPPQTIPVARLAGVTFPKLDWPVPPFQDSWMAQMSDGSAVQIQPGNPLKAQRFADWVLEPERVEAVWSQRDALRMPRASDFQEGRPHVVVFPTCRIAVPTVTFGSDSVSWDASGGQLLFPEQMASLKKNFADENQKIIPGESSILYSAAPTRQFPSIWFRPPSNHSGPQLGLRNGERFSLGETFRIGTPHADGIPLIGPQQAETTLPWDEVAYLKFE